MAASVAVFDFVREQILPRRLGNGRYRRILHFSLSRVASGFPFSTSVRSVTCTR
jgi:hypothetical protein